MGDPAGADTAQIVGAATNPMVARVWPLVEPVCAEAGVQLVHIEFQREHGGRTLRLYLDKPGGITLDDCAMISRQVGDLLDVALDSAAAYRLEVSSPGIHRPLGRRSDFDLNKGRRVKIRCAAPEHGQTNFTGTLNGLDGSTVQLTLDQRTINIEFATIVRANLMA